MCRLHVQFLFATDMSLEAQAIATINQAFRTREVAGTEHA
jgi:hypothetical protein